MQAFRKIMVNSKCSICYIMAQKNLKEKIYLSPHDFMPPPATEVIFYINVSPGSNNICSKNFEGIS